MEEDKFEHLGQDHPEHPGGNEEESRCCMIFFKKKIKGSSVNGNINV